MPRIGYPTIGSGYDFIVNKHSGLALDDTNWSTRNGAPVQQWAKAAGQANQEWKLVSAGGGYDFIMNKKSGLVLDDTNWSTSNGASVQQWAEKGQANQEWSLQAVGA